MSAWPLLPCTGDVFGGRAVELSGIVVDPEVQARGLGLEMIHSYLEPERDAAFITAYSRNPAIFRLFEKYDADSYPKCVANPKLVATVAEMPGATIIERVAYHINRYGAEGLYGQNDPAERINRVTGKLYKETYPPLRDIGTALILGAPICPGTDQSNFAIIKQRSPRP